MTLFLNGKKFLGLRDTSTDVSVIASHHWPTMRSCIQASADLRRVGSARASLQSAATIKWHDEEGHAGFFTLYVLRALPVTYGEEMFYNG
jgi:hypothetical protein